MLVRSYLKKRQMKFLKKKSKKDNEASCDNTKIQKLILGCNNFGTLQQKNLNQAQSGVQLAFGSNEEQLNLKFNKSMVLNSDADNDSRLQMEKVLITENEEALHALSPNINTENDRLKDCSEMHSQKNASKSFLPMAHVLCFDSQKNLNIILNKSEYVAQQNQNNELIDNTLSVNKIDNSSKQN